MKKKLRDFVKYGDTLAFTYFPTFFLISAKITFNPYPANVENIVSSL